MEGDPKTGTRRARVTVILVLIGAHVLQPLGWGQGVAVVAAGAHLVASGGGFQVACVH
jgi:hypothetical protein